ncbi:MAG TPA: hypothetical protein VFA98_16225 [Thermoanaerobaculia bacterium]|jgi:hypothetical protein|nr:hypothetical protein [Thermoanaerobaculia bacterium]
MNARAPKKRTLGIGMTVGSPFHRFYEQLVALQAHRRRGGSAEMEALLVTGACVILDEMPMRDRARAEEEWWRASPTEYDMVKAAEDAEREELLRPRGPCRNCGARQASTWWVGEGGGLAFAHGMAQAWCEPCCVQKQIEHAEEVAAHLPELRLGAERMKLLEVLGRRILR